MWWAAGEPRAHRGRSGGTQGTRGGGEAAGGPPRGDRPAAQRAAGAEEHA